MPQDTTADGAHYFDARGLSRRFRHITVFAALDSMEVGERMHFINDHDPQPLIMQIDQYFGPSVTFDYVKRDPGEVAIEFVKAA